MTAQASKNGKAGGEPVFDFSRVPRRRFIKRMSGLVGKTSSLQVQYEKMGDDLAELKTEQDSLTLQRETSEAGDANLVDREKEVRQREIALMEQIVSIDEQLKSMSQAQEELIASVLVSVPDDWWHPYAPAEERNFDDPENLDWLADGRFEELVKVVQTSSKNLGTLSSSTPSTKDS